MSDSKNGVMYCVMRLFSMAFVLFFFLSHVLTCMAAETKVIYVDIDAVGECDGTSWADAFTRLDVALASADESGVSCDIWVAEGAYRPTDGTSRDISFDLKSGVALYGGFSGTENAREDRDISSHETILTGEIGDTATSADNSYHVVCCISEDSSAILDGFTITGGNSDIFLSHDIGGGMYNKSSSPIVTNCTFRENNANYAGGMYNDNSSPMVTNCTFSKNSSTNGAGMYNMNSTLYLTNCIFIENSAIVGGSGMANLNSSLTVTSCMFSGNSAPMGGGMLNMGGSLKVTNCMFSENIATQSGGGMFNSSSSPTVTNCTFNKNIASQYGGGTFNDVSSPTFTNCTFNGNSSTNEGGAMYNGSSSPKVTNCILWNNSGGEVVDDNSSSPILSHCVISGDYTGAGTSSDIITSNPGLLPLADNGGPTMTCALGINSSAIDTGLSSGDSIPATDQRGVSRPQGKGYDIGAYEATDPPSSTGGSGGGCSVTTALTPSIVLLLVPLMMLGRRR